jgi:formylglycine-generating enzyme required for sulfatase activity
MLEAPVSGYRLTMVQIPASADGSVKSVWISRTEIPWEMFDTFIYRLDEEAGKQTQAAAAVSRPSKPYLPPDRGFGHEGYAAISMSAKNAAAFCTWLSAQTGRTFRLPSEAEWEHAARAGAPADAPWPKGVDPAQLADVAWFEPHANNTPHPIANKRPNAWGLFDMLGNVQEWVTGPDGKPTTKGGSYRDGADALKISARANQTPAWNSSDPQVPKSGWWLSDGPFVGFRIVCELDPAKDAANTKPATTPAR